MLDSLHYPILENLYENIKNKSIIELASDSERASALTKEWNGIAIDFSKNKITVDVLEKLIALAKERGVESSIEAMFSGQSINNTENRAVMHTLLRASTSDHSLFASVQEQKLKCQQFADTVRRGHLKGATGQIIDTIVNIGIGGSDLGPKLICDAFSSQIPENLNIHFLSDVDFDYLNQLLNSLNLERTLFILCSKSFSTWETQANAAAVIERLKQILGEHDWPKHFAGVAVDQPAMSAFGILPERQFLMWDSIGGRYSLWSSIGLVCRIAIGNDEFEQILQGAESMDQHFRSAAFENNLPILLALVQLWNIHWMQHQVFVTLPYKHSLRLFADYQQQLEMESNGKAVDKEGRELGYSTCPYIFGQLGLNAQHAFMQLIHQSKLQSYVEFIAVPDREKSFEEDVAFRSCLAQSRALMTGVSDHQHSFKNCPGDRPSTTLVIDKISPFQLGSLIALYEHKVFVQSVIWNINAFDQFGVELGKKIATSLTSDSLNDQSMDQSTRQLIARHCNK